MLHQQQADRISAKLILARQKDNKLAVFGASSHLYSTGNPITETEVQAFEDKYNVNIPDCYKAFVTQVGNGGMNYDNSAAGPFYGIYAFGTIGGFGDIENFFDDEPPNHLQRDCILLPNMSDSECTKLLDRINEDSELDIWDGILEIGSQGCSFYHGLVLNGAYKGRIINLDLTSPSKYRFIFAFENNFLDWYERWLDEVIAGELPSWFGYKERISSK